MSDVVCIGELLIDFVPLVTGIDLAGAETFRKAAGGAPANVAVGLARLGNSSAFMGQVGEDGFGRFLATTLADAGVDVAPLRFTRRARTSLAFVSLAADGEREFLFYRDPGADSLFAPEDVDADAIARAKILHFGSISLIADPARAATLHALDIAKRAGLRRSYDPNLRLALWPDSEAARNGMLLGLGHAEIVKISEDEVQFLTECGDPADGVRALWQEGLALLVVTLGAKGCRWFTRDRSGAVPGFVVEPVDATGAGDAFVAGLLTGLLEHPDALENPAQLDEICRFANAVGALTTTSRGAIPSLPGRGAVYKLMGTVGAAEV